MERTRDNIVRWLTMQSDMLCVLLAWLFAYYLRFHGPFTVYKGIPEWMIYVKLMPFILVIWLATFLMTGMYSKGRRYRSAIFEALAVLRSSLIALVVFIATSYFYSEYYYSRLTLFFFALSHPVFILAGRSALRKVFRYYKKRNPPRKILIIGAGSPLDKALELAASYDLASHELIGILGIGLHENSLNYAKELARQKSCSYFNLPDDWVNFFNEHPCETVIFALENDSTPVLSKCLEAIVEQVPDIKVLPDLSYLEAYNSGMEFFGKSALVNVHDSPLKGMGHLQKRLFDILGSIACIVIFSPVLFIVALLVKFGSPGKIFYTQERMGLDGRSFPILKFRTMPENVEKSSGAVWAQKDDGRTTAIGKWLRKTSLDELPQLFNVLMGQMSLVGPRPERPVFVAQFRRSVPGYMLRHKVKAGMTGWAQVQGWRGNTSIEKRIESDLYYIQNWSLALDIKILFLTAFKGFINTNAY